MTMRAHCRAGFKAMISRDILALAPGPIGADNDCGRWLRPSGSGHNATTVQNTAVVDCVVGFSREGSRAYPVPQRHNGKNHPSRVCVRVRLRRCTNMCRCLRCGVVLSLYLPEKKEEKRREIHNGNHNAGHMARCGMVNPLKNLKKRGI